MTRPGLWPQILVAWLPVGALAAMMIVTAHHETRAIVVVATALRMTVGAALLGFPVYRLTRRWPWPHRLDAVFIGVHLLAAPIYAVGFVAFNSVVESIIHHQLALSYYPSLGAFLVFAVWLYLITAGVTYALQTSQRAMRAEAEAARSQLAALRSQLNPHFLFNALHTVVHLIPRDPARAARAAEEVAGLLRTALEEDRDLVSFDEEMTFVRRYLAVERIRLGNRLSVAEETMPEARDAQVPVYAVQTLVENAVRHGAGPRVDPTTVTVQARADAGRLTVVVRDDGAGSLAGVVETSRGTGLRRLRERLDALYGADARLVTASDADAGFTASFSIPLRYAGPDDE